MWFTAGGAIPIAHYDVIDEILMKSSELSNGENRIALRQLSQTWKLRHYDVIDDATTRKV